jgi:hypothetical protein
MVRKWSTVPISLSYTAPSMRRFFRTALCVVKRRGQQVRAARAQRVAVLVARLQHEARGHPRHTPAAAATQRAPRQAQRTRRERERQRRQRHRRAVHAHLQAGQPRALRQQGDGDGGGRAVAVDFCTVTPGSHL